MNTPYNCLKEYTKPALQFPLHPSLYQRAQKELNNGPKFGLIEEQKRGIQKRIAQLVLLSQKHQHDQLGHDLFNY